MPPKSTEIALLEMELARMKKELELQMERIEQKKKDEQSELDNQKTIDQFNDKEIMYRNNLHSVLGSILDYLLEPNETNKSGLNEASDLLDNMRNDMGMDGGKPKRRYKKKTSNTPRSKK
jgi:hypothetical protein